jgi:hypothetical protein
MCSQIRRKDCRNAQQARELAVHLVPAGHDPIWHQAARQVLTALIIKLQVEKPETWNWHDLYLLVCRSHKELLSIMKTYTPEASNILEAPDKTAQSVLMHLSTNAWLIADLAKAWGDVAPDKRFSITDWIRGVDIKEKVLILQGSENYKVLSNAYIQLAFSLASGLINSPEIAKSDERRLWFFMDEFPQLGKLERFRSLLEIGRSKGIRIVLACQDIAQIREIYGEHAANSWLGIVGTYIFTRMGAGETANYVAEKMVGSKIIDRTVLHNNEKSAPVREKELVIEPFELNDKLGTNKDGVSALVLGVRDGLILDWPYTNTKKLSVHKAQGQTVDKVYLLMSEMMTDREWAYVGTSRHRKQLRVYLPEEMTSDLSKLLATSHQKEVTQDYTTIDSGASPRINQLEAELGE